MTRRLCDWLMGWGALLAGTALLILIGWASLAWGQPATCAPRDAMAETLAERWGETRRMVALDATGAMVELWASAETGTWTLTITRPGGPTCMVAAGTAWEAVEEAEGEPA